MVQKEHANKHLCLEERIQALQKIYDESGINIDAKEIYLKAER